MNNNKTKNANKQCQWIYKQNRNECTLTCLFYVRIFRCSIEHFLHKCCQRVSLPNGMDNRNKRNRWNEYKIHSREGDDNEKERHKKKKKCNKNNELVNRYETKIPQFSLFVQFIVYSYAKLQPHFSYHSTRTYAGKKRDYFRHWPKIVYYIIAIIRIFLCQYFHLKNQRVRKFCDGTTINEWTTTKEKKKHDNNRLKEMVERENVRKGER